MKRISRIYRNNIYSIIGTLLFHILVVAAFLVTEMKMKGEMKEFSLMVEFPVELPAAIIEEQETRKGEVFRSDGSSTNMPSRVTNEPSSGAISRSDRFFDEDYQREVNAARQLSTEVDQQLAKKSLDPASIEMPVDNTEGKSREEITNVIYSGESNIEYQLGERYHLRLPIPVYLARGGGVVIVDIEVNRSGRVISAKPRQSRSVTDEQVYIYAKTAAERTVFNSDPTAPASQSGTIRYTFIPQ